MISPFAFRLSPMLSSRAARAIKITLLDLTVIIVIIIIPGGVAWHKV
jgi:t-SNARE complex subunit (syntaxin)